jgi:hypothetical protein
MNETAHTIIRQAIDTPMGTMHKIECSCGRRIAMTNSLKIADQKAEYHLEVARADEEWGPDSAQEMLERPR